MVLTVLMLATMLPASTWNIFKELRTIGRKIVNYKSHEEFNGICVEQDLVALGLDINEYWEYKNMHYRNFMKHK